MNEVRCLSVRVQRRSTLPFGAVVPYPSLGNHSVLYLLDLPFFNLKENPAEKLPSDFRILPSDFRYWEFSTLSPNSYGEVRNSDASFSARFSDRLKKGRWLLNVTQTCLVSTASNNSPSKIPNSPQPQKTSRKQIRALSLFITTLTLALVPAPHVGGMPLHHVLHWTLKFKP